MEMPGSQTTTLLEPLLNPDLFMKRKWHYCFFLTAAYLFVVRRVPVMMKRFSGLRSRVPSILWNAFMTIFSVAMWRNVLPEFVDVIRRQGVVSSFCDSGALFEGDLGYWVAMFHFSKVIELGDTLLLIVRKRPVVYIHYFHHAVVLLYCWYSYRLYTAPARWGVFMNTTVHSLMYLYFLLVSCGVKLPSNIKVAVTSLQIVQFIIGSAICVTVFYFVQSGHQCDSTPMAATLQLCLYLYLLFLFSAFFYRSYIRKSKEV